MSSIVLTGDTSGTITVSAPAVAGTRTLTLPAATGTAILEDASGVLQMNSGYGSLADAYGCRAWVNFNGIGTVAIRDSGNVSSITDLGTGLYGINFSTSMPDVNYAMVSTASIGEVANADTATWSGLGGSNQTVSQVRIICRNSAGTQIDTAYASSVIFR